MQSLVDLLEALQQGAAPRTLGQRLGTDEASVRRGMAAAVPALVGALARNASRRGGAEALSAALERDHDGSILDRAASWLGEGSDATGDGILRHVFGERRGAVEAEVGRSSGIDAATVARLMTALAPLVMGGLGRSRRQQGLDPGGLADLLRSERSRVEAPDSQFGALARLLDADGDGQVADDVARLGGGLLRRLFGGRSARTLR